MVSFSSLKHKVFNNKQKKKKRKEKWDRKLDYVKKNSFFFSIT